ncbi:F-box family protein [Euphorbia peplus]|nr:F-box family protein [Euphorbia peplus]
MNEVTIPPEIIEEILIYLPAKSFIRFKSVCKAWSCLISDPKFKKRHDSNSKKSSHWRILLSSLSGTRYLDCERGSIRRLRISAHPVKIVGSSNGLVCLARDNCRDFIICNPSTEDYSWNLPNPELVSLGDAFKYGFSYDSSSHDYKIVVISNERNSPIPRIAIELFSLRKNSWKTIRDIDYDRDSTIPTYDRGGAVTFNGALHWPMLNYHHGVNYSIIGFDLQKEETIALATPIRSHYVNIRTGVIDECLCLSFYNGRHIDVLVMKEYGEVNSWQKLFSFRTPFYADSFGLLPLCKTASGEILWLKYGKHLLKVCFNDNTIQKLMQIKNRYRGCEAVVYEESLESPLDYI